jgi:spore maturation protein CgeB
MKMTVFGLTLSSSWGNGHATPYRALFRALNRLGHEITFYEKDVEYYALRRDMPECAYCKLVLYDDWREVRSQALAEAAESDVVMTASYLPQGSAINDEVLALDGPLKVFYDLDTPVTLSQLRRGELDYLRREQLASFDLVLSWTGGGALRALEKEFGANMARPLFGCVDPDFYGRTRPRRELTCSLSYMGTYAADRQAKLDELFLEPARRNPKMDFVLAGTLYPRGWMWPRNVRRFDHVAPDDHPVLYSSSRLTLNLTRAEMAESGYCPSGRLFEAAACCTPILSDWFEGLDAFFSPGVEILVAREACHVEKCIAVGDHDLERIGARARERTLDENTGMNRAHTLLKYLEEARGERRADVAGLEAA